jgi:hypothetical protein
VTVIIKTVAGMSVVGRVVGISSVEVNVNVEVRLSEERAVNLFFECFIFGCESEAM